MTTIIATDEPPIIINFSVLKPTTKFLIQRWIDKVLWQ